MRICFSLRGPLYLIVVSRNGECENALKEQLQWLYYQIVSVITANQLGRIFQKQANFDLRRLLGGTESFLDHICKTSGTSPNYILGAIRSVRMSPSLRQSAGLALQAARSVAKRSLIYGLLLVEDQLITILRPKKHSLHPSGTFLIAAYCSSSRNP